MLKYSVRITDRDISKQEMNWWEKYLSPDLSFVSGVTSRDYNISGDNEMESVNRTYPRNPNTLGMETMDVIRTGFIILKGYKYKVYDDITFDYSNNSQYGEEIPYYYVFINGKYYYAYEPDPVFHISGYQALDGCGRVVETTIDVPYDRSGFIKLDKIVWIEDGIVNIDGNDYFYNREDGEYGSISYDEGGVSLTAEEVADCDELDFRPYNVSDYWYVTKFILRKHADEIRKVNNIGYVKFFYFITYKDEQCPIRMDFDGDDFTLMCEVPKYLLSATTYGENYEEYETVDIPVLVGYVDDDHEVQYEEANSDNLKEYRIFDFEELYKVNLYVRIDDALLNVDHEFVNANDGYYARVELDGAANNIGLRTKLHFQEITSDETYLPVIIPDDSPEYKFTEEEKRFVVYDSEKYKVIDNLCDRVKIADGEYEIDYVNGREIGEDCMVMINGEEVPMKIIEDKKLQRYGFVVVDPGSAARTGVYDIKTYDGVIIEGRKYPVVSGDSQVVVIDLPNKHTFNVITVKGSSMVICKPFLNRFDFTDEFYSYYSRVMCEDIVENKDNMMFFTKNNTFGEDEITRELAFQKLQRPISSDDYYNLFDDLVLFSDVTYVNMNIPLVFNPGGNVLQDNLIDRDFVKAKTEEAINPIVDMEKDVYIPKYIANNNGLYSGSKTEFKPIDEIRINLHFRTRNEDNWKINEGYNIVDTSGSTDNWFVTDFYPYKGMLSDAATANQLQETSDIMGLLYFTNDDIFYQKQKVGKSFVRLTYYDSTDSNTQSLLCNSCVFLDYHSMFKTYMDNSQKNINKFCIAGEEDAEKNAVRVNRISTKTEVIDKKTGKPAIKEENRVSSRLTVKNKYETTTSSEGFYLYIFREYSENLRPKPIYMKVDFNHAGIGRTIPFMIPMRWKSGGGQIVNPEKTLTLRENLSELKKGIQLSHVNQQLYIPLYAVYDFKNKEYAYVFDNRYVKVDVTTGIANINLFELKIMDETNGTNTESKRNDILRQKQTIPLIDINTNQFKITDPKCTQ